MRAKDLINYTIPPLKVTDKIEKALEWMRELHVHELPVVEDGKFLGLFNENLFIDVKADAEVVGDFQLISSHLFVNQDEHYYEVLKKAYDASSNLVAVVKEDNTYIGSVTIQDVVEAFSKMSSIHSPGTIIVLGMPASEYSMTEIGRIVESENGKILSSFVEQIEEDQDRIRVTIKINLDTANPIVSAFERYGYTVASIFGKENDNDLDKERLDTLMRYLKI